MDNIKKIAIFLVLLTSLSVCSFAETFYSIYTGLFRLSEQFFDDKYGRELDGINFNLSVNYYPTGSSLGWFVTGSAGGGISGFEWTESYMSSLDFYSATDLRLSFGPSYKVVSGSTMIVPVSLGAVFSNYREESYYYGSYDYGYGYDDYYYSYNDTFYEAISFGLLADASIIITPFRWFVLRIVGISVTWDFLRFERGNMQMNYRSIISGGQFRNVSYGAFNFCIYSGIGVRF